MLGLKLSHVSKRGHRQSGNVILLNYGQTLDTTVHPASYALNLHFVVFWCGLVQFSLTHAHQSHLTGTGAILQLRFS